MLSEWKLGEEIVVFKSPRKKRINFTEKKKFFLNRMAFYPQGAMSQISQSSDKIKFSFVIFLQSFSSYSTEQESHRRQKKKIFMNFLF